MNHHLLHLKLSQTNGQIPWPVDLTSLNIVVLEAKSPKEAQTYIRAYDLMTLLVELDSGDDEACACLRDLNQMLADKQSTCALVGLAAAPLTANQRQALAESGLSLLLTRDDPIQFLLWHIDMLRRLCELSQFEKTRMDVGSLASQTRKRLHDISQPLSALQGRLQLMASKCDQQDPNAAYLNEMVKLIFEVSRQLMEIQQMHRIISG